MRPTVLLPREHDAVARHPQQLLVGDDVVERAARAKVGLPDLAPGAGRDLRDADRPRLRLPSRRKGDAARLGRRPREGDARSVRRPHRVVVALERRIEEPQRLPGHVVDGDESVVAAVAHEGELAAVRRPAQRARRAAGVDQLLGWRCIRERCPPDLPALDERHVIALGRDGRGVALAQAAHRPAGNGHQPDLLLDAGRHAAGVGELAASVGAPAARVRDRLPVRRPGEIADLLAVVVRVGGDRAALILGWCGDPDVARAVGVEHPGHGAARRCRDEVVGERRGKRLLERERGLLGGERGRRDQRDGEGGEAVRADHRKLGGLRARTKLPARRAPSNRPRALAQGWSTAAHNAPFVNPGLAPGVGPTASELGFDPDDARIAGRRNESPDRGLAR